MSVFDGEIDFKTVYMTDYVEKETKRRQPAKIYEDDSCLITGISRDALKAREDTKDPPDVLCPIKREHYKDAVKRFEEDYPKLTKMYMSKDLDPRVVENYFQDLKRTEYLTEYCDRDLPFMSANLNRRAANLPPMIIPDGAHIPDTIYESSYRPPKPERYAEPPSKLCTKPIYDDSLQKKLREICRVRTGETVYQVNHSLLGKVIIERQPFGPARTEPKYGRWKTPYYYTYRLN